MRMQQMDMVRSRAEGRVIPGWQHGRLRVYWGVLLMQVEYHPFLRRYAMTARMAMADIKAEPPPPLLDAQTIEKTRDRWIYSGWERIDEGDGQGSDHAQTWVLVPARDTKDGYHGSERV